MEDGINVLFVAIMLVSSFYLGKYLSKLGKFNFLFARKGRYGAIDGLRGYLALAVFVHHFIITWYWHNSGEWVNPPENYFDNFGEVGVMLFFMITGFLFVSKILLDNGKTDWYRLYKSRIFRIYPLYLFALLVVSIIIFIESDFHLNVEFSTLAGQYTKWLLYHGAMINDHAHSQLINAGVDWTLKYEWLFYLSLPFVAYLIGKNRLFLIPILLIAGVLYLSPAHFISFSTKYLLFFAIGAMIAYLNFIGLKRSKFAQAIDNRLWSVATLIVLLVSLVYSDTGSLIHVLFVSMFFLSIALGNTMFGLLRSRGSILLGEISYSIYLLHGYVIYTLFSTISIIDLTQISMLHYLIWLPFIAALVILVAVGTYLMIELPSIKFGREEHAPALRSWLLKRRSFSTSLLQPQ